MKLIGIGIGFIFAVLAYAQKTPDPNWRGGAMPMYPPLARQARIQGRVKLEFVITGNGEVASIDIVSGHPMLAPAAVETVTSWHFNVPEGETERKFETTFDFKLDTNADPRDADKISITSDTFRHIEVIARFSEYQVSDCPSEQTSKPPASIVDGDFVEMSTSGCFGPCSVYTVRVAADGTVTWKGDAYVAVKGKRQATVTSPEAMRLLERFRSKEFWSLCGSYSRMVTDSAGTDIRVRIGGRLKNVSNYAGSAPDWVNDLEFEIGSVANTHVWRHGNPPVEPISRVGEDAYGPKPGVTPLMRAAARDNTKAIEKLLKGSADVSATDASGWTPLMYAAASGHQEAVQMLLAAGAKPNQVSPRGDTALMAAAAEHTFDQNIVQAGADVNARNSDGVTALMILASEGEADEIESALKAGADPTLKDSKGRTALDHLQLANCGKSPLRDEVRTWMSLESHPCKAFGETEYQKALRLLGAAS